MKKIALIGCTGNIGTQTAEIVRANRGDFCFSALVCKNNAIALEKMKEEFSPAYAFCLAEGELSDETLSEIFSSSDVALIAAGGFAGLRYTLAAARAGKTVALANKESLVCGGALVTREIEKYGAQLVPVDSEHSALFQALNFHRDAPFERLVLTASGGPFFRYSKEQLKGVTAKDALCHPTWNMGAKITVDSATLLNKGYEVIEAKWLYGAEFSQIEAVVHPESIVHSLVYLKDGAAMAQLAYPDMRLPIQLALTFPERKPCLPRLDLVKLGALHFYPFPQENFPCFTYAVEAGKAGGVLPTALNAAGEVAAHAFLRGEISFLRIAEILGETLSHTPNAAAESYLQLLEEDKKARKFARKLVYD